ncbi:cellulase family glycosylhydrolase [Gordonia sp. NPDC003504]
MSSMPVIAPHSSAVLSTVPAPTSVPIQLVAVIDENSTTIGIADSSLYGLDSATLNTTLDKIAALGVTSVRVAIPWVSVEYLEGSYNWTQLDALVAAADARGMSIVATVTGTPFWAGNIVNGHFDPAEYAEFVGAVATRYQGDISGYEIWNEPNAALFYNPIDPVAYTEVLKAAYTAIKAADPAAVVIAGVLGATVTTGATLNPITFVEQMYSSGAAGYFDALSFHPYQYLEEYTDNDHDDSPASQIAAIRALMAQYGDAAKKIWITEYGQPTGGTHTQAEQATFIENFIEAWQNEANAGPIYIYSTRDTNTGSSNLEDNFGLYTTNWVAKPAAQVLADLIARYSTTASNTGDFGAAFAAAMQQLLESLVQAQAAALQQMLESLAAALESAFGASAAPAVTTTSTLAARVASPSASSPSEETPVSAASAETPILVAAQLSSTTAEVTATADSATSSDAGAEAWATVAPTSPPAASAAPSESASTTSEEVTPVTTADSDTDTDSEVAPSTATTESGTGDDDETVDTAVPTASASE